MLDGGEDGQTKVGTQMGTPPYMSPERVEGRPYGRGCDVWAVGVVLFEMLALMKPFDGGTLLEVARQIGRGEPCERARRAIESCGHEPHLVRLASPIGLLHKESDRRTPLRAVLQRFPLNGADPADDGGCTPDSEARHDDLVRTLLQGPPLSHAGASEASAASTMHMVDVAAAAAAAAPPQMPSLTARSLFVPLEVPSVPMAFEPRADLTRQLSARIADPSARGLAGATVAFGMGGSGKSTMIASLVRGVASHTAAYECVCWVPVGQSPDLPRLLGLLARQLSAATGTQMGSAAAAPLDDAMSSRDMPALTKRLAEAANGRPLLCVLDDVWDPEVARVLGEPLGPHATLLVTTRIHHLLPGAHHLHCGLLSAEVSLRLLLIAGEIDADRPPPPAAYEIVKLCGRLPLTIALAGAMIQEHADDWEERLVPLLRGGNKAQLRTETLASWQTGTGTWSNREPSESDDDDDDDDGSSGSGSDSGDAHGGTVRTGGRWRRRDDGGGTETMEGRVITSSLTLLRSRGLHAAVGLFQMMAAFPEDATVKCAVFECLEHILRSRVAADPAAKAEGGHAAPAHQAAATTHNSSASASASSSSSYVKDALSVLLSYSLLLGSLREGVTMHDLLRAHALAHTRPEDRIALQSTIVRTLCSRIHVTTTGGGGGGGGGGSGGGSGDLMQYALAHLEHHASDTALAEEGSPRSRGSAKARATRGEGGQSTKEEASLLTLAVEHPLEWVRWALGRGIGETRLKHGATQAAGGDAWLQSARLWMLASMGVAHDEAACRWEVMPRGGWIEERGTPHPAAMAGLPLTVPRLKPLPAPHPSLC